MPLCAAINCNNRKGKYFYRFPSDPLRRKQWEVAVKRANFKSNDNHRICEEHFEGHCFEKNLEQARKAGYKTVALQPDAVPTLLSLKKIKSPRKSLAMTKRTNLKVCVYGYI